MSPFARTLQILCLAIGLAFVITGLVTTDTRHHFLSLRQTWDCRPSGSGSSCTSDGDLENGTQRPITLGITGLGFLVASVSIAAGANRRTAPPPRTSTRVRNDGTGWSVTLVMVTSVTSVSPCRWVDAVTRTGARARDWRPVRSAYPVNAAP